MGKIIIHSHPVSGLEIEKMRILRNLERTPEERMKLMFGLNALALTMKNAPLKMPQGKGVV